MVITFVTRSLELSNLEALTELWIKVSKKEGALVMQYRLEGVGFTKLLKNHWGSVRHRREWCPPCTRTPMMMFVVAPL